jgi:L,D-transpeptidase ErfK/SrfK
MRTKLMIVLLLASAGTGTAGGHESAPAPVVGGITTHVVAHGETLTSIAARFGVYPTTIAGENDLPAGRPLEAGRELRIDNRHIVPPTITPGEIVINLPQRMLFFTDADRVTGYPVAVGRPTWRTPSGPFTVIEKRRDPAWHVPASIRAESARAGRTLPSVVPPGPANPLGPFWIGTSLAGIGVHGTSSSSSIYQTATHGCIRLQNDRIADVYASVHVGTPGRILYEPLLLAVVDDEVYLEVHPDAYKRLAVDAHQRVRMLAAELALSGRIDWTAADQEIERRAGVARRVSIAR